MYLTSDSFVPDENEMNNVVVSGDDATINDLVSQVRLAFPNLSFSSAVVEERGGDHRVLLLDATYAFRFPRETTHNLELEIAVLAALRERCGVDVPDYCFLDPVGRFAGYRYIVGTELTPALFAELAPSVQHRVLDQAGRFLAALHDLSPDAFLAGNRWPVIPSGARQAADARRRSLPQIARTFPKLVPLIDTFYRSCSGDGTGRQVIVHGDLVDDHILLAPNRKWLSGIIDFGDVALGDPAQDLLGFWVYGEMAVARVIAAYGAGADADICARSRRAFVRYNIDRFAELLASDGKTAAERSLPALVGLLASHGTATLSFRPTDAMQRKSL